MTRSSERGNEPPEKAWARWARVHQEMLERATGPQQALLEATVRFLAVIAGQPIMSRAAAFFLLHAGMGLTPAQVGAAIGRTDRAMGTQQLRLILDAGAAKSHASLARLHRFRKTVFLIRTPRHRAYVKAWKRLPRDTFTPRLEPGPYVDAKPKAITRDDHPHPRHRTPRPHHRRMRARRAGKGSLARLLRVAR